MLSVHSRETDFLTASSRPKLDIAQSRTIFWPKRADRDANHQGNNKTDTELTVHLNSPATRKAD
jgi:hypothetical protein